MKILLIRHAEQEYPRNSEGKQLVALRVTPLSETGIRQAHELAKKIDERDLTPNALFGSPYLRTHQTATIIQGELQITVLEEIEDLGEVFPNESEGHTLEELDAIRSDVYTHPFGPNQETLEHLVNRQRNALKKILDTAERNGDKTIAIISHGDPLAALYWALRNKGIPESYAEMRKDYYPEKGEALEFDYADGHILNTPRIITNK